jgi:geranylgeranyl diphosphate synthase type I
MRRHTPFPDGGSAAPPDPAPDVPAAVEATLATFLATQAEAVNALDPALAALELLHAFALVHDDIMDGSPTRRGHPTAHRALTAEHAGRRLRGDAGRFGEAGAILVGDLCLVWADQLIAQAGLPGDTLAAVRRSYDRMRVEAIAGQFLDVLGEHSRNWSIDSALRTARLKTAGYTVTQPLHYGAALAGTEQGTAESQPLGRAYARYGRAVGVAFQLRDDLLGMYGEPGMTGKPVGEDLARGKPTVLLQVARALANGGQAAELERLLRERPQDGPQRLAALVTEIGAPVRLGRMIAERVADALDALKCPPMDPAAQAALADLARAAAWRIA